MNSERVTRLDRPLSISGAGTEFLETLHDQSSKGFHMCERRVVGVGTGEYLLG